jgi:hypothetical protein
LGLHTPLSAALLHCLEEILMGMIMGGTALMVVWLRWRQRLSREAASLLLISALFVVSAHIFPWYTTVLVPLAATLLNFPEQKKDGSGPRLIGPAALWAWYFACATPLAYFFMYARDWTLYYALVYWPPLLGLAQATLASLCRPRADTRS